MDAENSPRQNVVSYQEKFVAYQNSRNERKRHGAEEDCYEASWQIQPQREISSFEWRDQRRDIRLVRVVFLRRKERKNSGGFVVKSSGLRAILLNESRMVMRIYRTKTPPTSLHGNHMLSLIPLYCRFSGRRNQVVHTRIIS